MLEELVDLNLRSSVTAGVKKKFLNAEEKIHIKK